MAVNVLVPLLIPLGEQLTNVTQLAGVEGVELGRRQYLAEVREDAAPGVLLQLTARVLHQGHGVTFSIKEGADEGLFSLEPSSGRLSLLKKLDYEKKQQHQLVVEALAGQYRSEAQVTVEVQDVNEYPPVFPRSLHQTQITEEDDSGLPKTILRVLARDGDAGEWGKVTYRLIGDGVTSTTSSTSSSSSSSSFSSSSSSSSFSIHPHSGAIDLLAALDRDPPHGRPQWRLKVTATDGELEATTNVYINLKDVNDNAPYFPSPVLNVSIPEDAPQGSSVAQVVARDNDDPKEGYNARLVYSLQKNVIDESSGMPLFTVDSQTGLITTALCCLDREKTPKYILKAAATDGGGLKATGTVLVQVADINDAPPRFSQREWNLQVPENLPVGAVLGSLPVTDRDADSSLTFRVVPESGRGWRLFQVEAAQGEGATGGHLRALVPLDYENPDHRGEFQFKVEVTDKGPTAWQKEAQHVDATWVTVRVTDVNDNTPILTHAHAHRTLPEDTPTGTHIASFSAHDADAAGNSGVRYVVAPKSDPSGAFGVDEGGTVVLAGALDRETAHAHEVLVWAVDDGTPPRTATATLTVNVTDVNDNPPFLREPKEVQVEENAGPRVVARVKLGDKDSWGSGHGPPFTVTLDPHAPPHVAAVIKVSLDVAGDDGRGVGVVETRASLDREAGRMVLVPLVVGDAGHPQPVTTTVTLTVHVGDVNDNLMTPASKSVTAHTLKASPGPQLPVAVSDVVPLGRIYVRDPDDWDAATKTYSWRGPEHPNFTLDTATGHLTMRATTREGKYQLGFKVSDAAQGQFGVTADVTIEVRSVRPNDVTDATPLTLEATPYEVVREEGEGSVLSRLVGAARAWVTGGSVGVMVVSVEPLGREPPQRTRVWLSGASTPHSLHHLLRLHRTQLAEAAGVAVGEVGLGACREGRRPGCAGGCVLRAGLSGQFSLVDANTSAVTGPRLALHTTCSCGTLPGGDPGTCTPDTCLNGGRCVHASTGARCVCPHHAHGSKCKVLTRHFKGDKNEHAWAWAPPVPACAEMHLSLEVLTSSLDATLLYAGPDRPPPTPALPAARDVVALELRAGRPSLMLDLGGGPVTLTVNTTAPLSDNTWHRLDVLWRKQVVLLLVDLCSGGSMDSSPTPDVPHNHSTSAPPPAPHTCRARRRLPSGGRFLDVPGPLQVGGLAHPPPPHAEYGWPRPLTDHPFTGCLRNLRVNGELVDLGHSLLGRHSVPGCPDADCASSGLTCGSHGRCRGSPGSLWCECQAGWTGEGCTTPTQPTSFLPSSYVRLALSFTPLAHTTSLQLRFRTRQQDGQLVVLSSQHSRDRLSLQLVQGHLCLLLHLHPQPPRSLCLSKRQLTDGRWHVVSASRHGSTTLLAVDEGDGDLYNASISLGDSEGSTLLQVDKQVGLHVGGLPEYAGVSVINIHGDYHDGCVDDVRVSGRVVPLPPAANSTPWGQASMFQGVRDGCSAPPACANVSCRPPLICVDTWRSYHCGCGAGQVLSGTRDTCEDEDECAWDPCLHGGTCLNKPSGFLCQCVSGFSGRHCHLPGPTDTSLRISLTALVAIVAWSVLILLVVCALLLHQHHRRAALRRGGPTRENGSERAASPSLARPHPQGANGQPAWTTAAVGEPDVLELQVNHRHPGSCPITLEETGLCVVKVVAKRKGSENGVSTVGERKRGGGSDVAAGDDLRNYSYEGEGSSPGSLSSCLESCGGSAKFLGGFREVARVLESWEPPSVRSTHSTPTKTEASPSPTHHISQDLGHQTPCLTSLPTLPAHTVPPALPVSSEGVSQGFPTPES